MPPIDDVAAQEAGQGAGTPEAGATGAPTTGGENADPSTLSVPQRTDNPPASNVEAEPIAGDYGAPQEPAPEEQPRRKRGRPSKAEIAARLGSVTPAPPKPSPVPPGPSLPSVDYESTAQTAANLWFNVPQLVLGEEWAPSQDEILPIKNAFKDYFVSEQIGKIPPAWALSLMLLAYTGKRLTKPTIKQRVFGAFEWLKSKVKFGR